MDASNENASSADLSEVSVNEQVETEDANNKQLQAIEKQLEETNEHLQSIEQAYTETVETVEVGQETGLSDYEKQDLAFTASTGVMVAALLGALLVTGIGQIARN